MPDRVTVFIDAQNMYRSARRAFFDETVYHVNGQFNPKSLSELIVQSGRADADRVLTEVRVYTGRPDATKQAKAYSAHMKNCAAWQANGVHVTARGLRYPRNWPRESAREKGIDVALTIDFVTMAIDDKYDVGVLVSVDTDMTPALEYVAKHPSLGKTVEVAAWRSDRARGRLGVKGLNVWCHWLDFAAYDSVADLTDYAA